MPDNKPKTQNSKLKSVKRISIILGACVLFLVAILIIFKLTVTINPPVIGASDEVNFKRIQIDTNSFVCGDSWLRKSKSGLWEMYIEGKPYERGLKMGVLSKDLLYLQEKAFVNELHKLVPSDFYLRFLKYFVAWFNRHLDKYVNKEFQLEIYGISKSASDEFSFIGPAYQRMLNFHAAHDIGHALQNMNMVACTSFSAWSSKAEDSSLIVGRNFDFYVGDDFAKNKIVCFCNPDKGYKFMYVTWAGMIGVTSGMNEKGLTVTLNAAKSEIPYSSATPISIVAREILQYARNIKEAYDIAEKNKTFVSESIMIGSAEDNKTAIIEKTPHKIGLFFSKNNYIICTNHFQGDMFKYDKLNLENINNSSTYYRYKRVDELINQNNKINYKNAAEILRDMKGLGNKDIGLGNEKAINQLIAHHSVIFMPSKLLVWVSANPFQLGKYIAYDLNKIFKMNSVHLSTINEEQLTIPADTFLFSDKFKDFNKFKVMKSELSQIINSKSKIINLKFVNDFISSNPEYFMVYSLVGDYYKTQNDITNEFKYYKLALTKEIPTLAEKKNIEKSLKSVMR